MITQKSLKSRRCGAFAHHTQGRAAIRELAEKMAAKYDKSAKVANLATQLRTYRARCVPGLKMCIWTEAVLGLPHGTIYGEVAGTEKKTFRDLAKTFPVLPESFGAGNDEAPVTSGSNCKATSTNPIDILLNERGMSSKALAELLARKAKARPTREDVRKLEFSVRAHRRSNRKKVDVEFVQKVAEAVGCTADDILSRAQQPVTSEEPTPVSVVANGATLPIRITFNAATMRFEDEHGNDALIREGKNRFLKVPVDPEFLLSLIGQ